MPHEVYLVVYDESGGRPDSLSPPRYGLVSRAGFPLQSPEFVRSLESFGTITSLRGVEIANETPGEVIAATQGRFEIGAMYFRIPRHDEIQLARGLHV